MFKRLKLRPYLDWHRTVSDQFYTDSRVQSEVRGVRTQLRHEALRLPKHFSKLCLSEAIRLEIIGEGHGRN